MGRPAAGHALAVLAAVAVILPPRAARADMRFTPVPVELLYPQYVTAPLRSAFEIAVANYAGTEMPEVDDTRFHLRLGGRYGFLRWHPADEPGRGFQFDLAGGFLGMFDLENSLDNIGWDGLLDICFSWANGRGTAVKAAVQHDSSHVGDEYAEKTGRTRVDYTREELALGLSRADWHHLRLYGEAGYGLESKELQAPWRLQGGVEWQGQEGFGGSSLAPYAAVDLGAYEENDWDVDLTAQGGLATAVAEAARTYRFGLEYRNGRSLLGEFFQRREEYLSVGLWMEL